MTEKPKYDKQISRISMVIRADQKAWLRQKVTPLRSMSDVLRDILDAEIARNP